MHTHMQQNFREVSELWRTFTPSSALDNHNPTDVHAWIYHYLKSVRPEVSNFWGTYIPPSPDTLLLGKDNNI